MTPHLPRSTVVDRSDAAHGPTGPMTPPSRTGVRLAGDDYQWLHAWRACLQVLRDQSPQAIAPNRAVAVGVEVDHAGNVDDVVLYRQHSPAGYSQVKYAVDAASPVNTAFLTAASAGNNLLRKLADAYATLRAAGDTVDMSLITNRSIDPSDKLVAGRDARSGLLLPKAALGSARSALGKQRRAWAEAAGITEAELLDLLAVLKFETGHDVRLLSDNVANMMAALGLRTDEATQKLVVGWIRQQVINGVRKLDLDSIRGAVQSLELEVGPAWTTISIATLKPDPLADQAIYVLDWSDKFEGSDPYARRRPRSPATWPELDAEIHSLSDKVFGATALLITGSLRLPTGFAVGAALRNVAGFHVAIRQGHQLWRSDENYADALAPHVEETHVGQGDDLAVVIDVAFSATPSVLRWIQTSVLPVSRLMSISPPDSAPRDNSIPDPRTAVALATGIRNTVRENSAGVPRIHLFQAGPLGLAVLLGNRWNRVRPTVAYEEIPAHGIYEAAFEVEA